MEISQSEAMIKAAFDDDAEEVVRLVAKGFPIGPDPRHGNTPLRTACCSNSIRALRALLENGANPNERITYQSAMDRKVHQDFTPLMYASTAEAVDLLVQFGADVNAVSSTGLSALMRSAFTGTAEAVEALLRHGADKSLRLHKSRGRKPHNALELARDSLGFLESLPKETLKPEAQLLIEQHRKTVQLLT